MDSVRNQYAPAGTLKKYRLILLYTVAWIIVCLFDRFRWDFVIRTTYMAGVLTTQILIVSNVLLLIFAIICAWVVQKAAIARWIPLALWGLIIIYSQYLVFSAPMIKADFLLHNGMRERAVQMILEKEMERYQIGDGIFMAPMRFASYDGRIFVKEDGQKQEILFPAYIGVGKTLFICYESEAGQKANVMCLDTNWYARIVDSRGKSLLD